MPRPSSGSASSMSGERACSPPRSRRRTGTRRPRARATPALRSVSRCCVCARPVEVKAAGAGKALAMAPTINARRAPLPTIGATSVRCCFPTADPFGVIRPPPGIGRARRPSRGWPRRRRCSPICWPPAWAVRWTPKGPCTGTARRRTGTARKRRSASARCLPAATSEHRIMPRRSPGSAGRPRRATPAPGTRSPPRRHSASALPAIPRAPRRAWSRRPIAVMSWRCDGWD